MMMRERGDDNVEEDDFYNWCPHRTGEQEPLFNQEKPLRELKEQRGNPAHIGGEIQRERDPTYEKQDLFGNFLSSQQVFWVQSG